MSVFMDVEDPINPHADDAALQFANLFTECRVRGSFCVTGEKCRTLLARGRLDVAGALAPHCLGLHTDTHSQHPTTMELLADVPLEEGCRLAFEAEKRGFDAFVALFGRAPSFWGGAGNTWSPEITEALKRLGIPAYSYALTGVPDGGIHRFNGVVALPQHVAIGETNWCDSPQSIPSVREDWTGIFVGHPTRFRYAEFWDKAYAEGRTPVVPEAASLSDDAAFGRGKANLRAFLLELDGVVEIVGVDEVVGSLGPFRKASTEDQDFFAQHTAGALRSAGRWPIHRPDLDVSGIEAKALARSRTLEVQRTHRRHSASDGYD